MSDEKFIFTPENLLDNLHRLGPWSAYGLASDALSYYFPLLYDDEEGIAPSTMAEVDLLYQLGLESWEDVIRKYQIEVGWSEPFSPQAVNEH